MLSFEKEKMAFSLAEEEEEKEECISSYTKEKGLFMAMHEFVLTGS